MNSSIYYDFQTKKVIDPLESITSFYVNPYMPETNKMLGIEEKIQLYPENMGVADSQVNVSVSFVKGIPVLIMPIALLNLSRVHVTFSSVDDDKIIIRQDRLKLYVKLFKDNPSLVRIDSVLYC